MPLLRSPSPIRKGDWIAASIVLVLLVGILDCLTGKELAFSPFYLTATIPVEKAKWRNRSLFTCSKPMPDA